MKSIYCLSLFLLCLCFGCQNNIETKHTKVVSIPKDTVESNQKLITEFDTTTQTIHIIVALCDNKYQGIVPVPPAIGNGQDPHNNLYWGTAYGIHTYFKKSSEWNLISKRNIDSLLLERVIFKHYQQNVYLVADAYNGKNIKQATENFLRSSAGLVKDTLNINNHMIGIEGNAKLIALIGHNGLMDFELTETFVNEDKIERDIIILGCISKDYFEPVLKDANVNPLVWTTGLMAPEAYTIHDAITGYLNGEENLDIRLRAAKAYSKYQKCSLRAAKNLLVTSE